MAASAPQVPMASSNGTGRSGHEYFDRLRQRSLDEGCSRAESRRAALEAYLDGKPHASGKLKPTKSERDRWFWASAFVAECAPGDWCTDAGILTLTRYLSQAKMTVDGLVGEIARTSPQALVTAMRRAQLVLTPESPHLLAADELLLGALGLSQEEPPAHVHGWIVDTSIESDHERFGGFLKVSLEEVIVALRDDRALLFDPEGLVSGQTPASVESADGARGSTLYPSGFDAPRFVEVIETEQVWESIGRNT